MRDDTAGRPLLIVKTESEWRDQAREAARLIVAKNGSARLSWREAAAVDREACAALLEAIIALRPRTRQPVSAELMALAMLGPRAVKV
jgi:hypothetical protein